MPSVLGLPRVRFFIRDGRLFVLRPCSSTGWITIIPEMNGLSNMRAVFRSSDNILIRSYTPFEEPNSMTNRGEKKLSKLAEPDSEPETLDEVDKEELKSAKEVVQFLTKTAKTLKIYL